MKSPIQRLLWQRKLELLERRPLPAAPDLSEIKRRSLWRVAYMLIVSDPIHLTNKGSWIDCDYQPPDAASLSVIAAAFAYQAAYGLRYVK